MRLRGLKRVDRGNIMKVPTTTKQYGVLYGTNERLTNKSTTNNTYI